MTANPSTIALYARKLTEYQDFLAKDLTHGTLREGPASSLPDSIRQAIEQDDKKLRFPSIGHWQELCRFRLLGAGQEDPPVGLYVSFRPSLAVMYPFAMWGLQHQKAILPFRCRLIGMAESSGIKEKSWSSKTTVETFIGAGNWRRERRYSLIISSRNGLLRYAMRDRIRVTGFYQNTPIISFVGKEGRFINAVGEKVTEEQLVLAIQGLEQVLIGFTACIEWAEIPRIHLGVEWKGLWLCHQ